MLIKITGLNKLQESFLKETHKDCNVAFYLLHSLFEISKIYPVKIKFIEEYEPSDIMSPEQIAEMLDIVS